MKTYLNLKVLFKIHFVFPLYLWGLIIVGKARPLPAWRIREKERQKICDQ